MQLVSIHIDNFGGICDYSVNLTKGLNVFYEENGWGKSTLAAFIRVMFYGFLGETKRTATRRERQYYKPWNKGTYGGELIFEKDGKRYKIFRTFGSRASEDEFALFDATTMLPSDAYTSNIGEEIFGIDAESFGKTILIAQSDCETSATDKIHARFGGMEEIDEDLKNYDKVQEKLKKKMDSLNPNRATGSIHKHEEERNIVLQEMYELKYTNSHIADTDEKMSRCKARIEQLNADINYYSGWEKDSQRLNQIMDSIHETQEKFPKDVPTVEDVEKCANNYEYLQKNSGAMEYMREASKSTKEEYDGYRRRFGGKNIEGILGNIKDLKARRKAGRDELDDLQLDIRLLQKKIQDIEEELEEAGVIIGDGSQDNYTKVWKIKKLRLLIGMFLLGFGGCGSYMCSFVEMNLERFVPFFVVFLFGIVMFLLGFQREEVLLSPEESEDFENPIQENENHDSRIQKLEEMRQGFYNEMNRKNQDYMQLKHEMDDCERMIWENLKLMGVDEELFEPDQIEEAILSASKQYDRYTELEMRMMKAGSMNSMGEMDLEKINAAILEDIQSFFEKYEIEQTQNLGEQLRSLYVTANLYRDAIKEYTKLRELIMKSSMAKHMSTSGEEACFSEEEIIEKVACVASVLIELKQELVNRQKELEELRTQKEHLVKAWEMRNNLQSREQELVSIISNDQEEYAKLAKTRELLAKAKNAYSKRYAAPVWNAFSRYYSCIANDDTGSFLMDTDTKLTIQAEGLPRELSSLSKGNRDLIGFCMRMAYVDAMYRNEDPFLVFDDPFANLDDQRLIEAMNLLNDIGRQRQVIYFTCHKSRCSV